MVAGTRKPFRRDGTLPPSASCLQDMEEGKADRLLDLGIALDFDISMPPERVQVGTLLSQETFPTREASQREGSHNLVVNRGPRALARPAIGQEFDDAQPLARLQRGSDDDADNIGRVLRLNNGLGWPLNVMIHRGAYSETADSRVMHQEPTRC